MNTDYADQLIEITKDLIAIPSTAHDPEALHQALDFVTAMVRSACPDVAIERFESKGVPSLLAYRGPQRPDRFHIILNGHLDVVPGKPDQYTAVVRDGKLYGRGAYDMKAACVIMASVFCEFVHTVPYALGLQIVTDEESAGKNGTLYQVEHGVRADFVICGESGRSTSVREIANETKGFVMAEIGFSGKAAHSAYPWMGDNAAIRAASFSHLLHEQYPVPSEETDGTVISVTSIVANSGAHSKIPDSATIKLVARYASSDPNFKTKQRFISFIKSIDPTAKVMELHEFGSPIYTSPTNALLLSLKQSAEEIEGAAFSFIQRHGTGDGRFYGALGDEACEFGIAGEYSHSDNEYITLEAFRNYLATMRNFLGKTASAEQSFGTAPADNG